MILDPTVREVVIPGLIIIVDEGIIVVEVSGVYSDVKMNRDPDCDWTNVFILSNSFERITFLQFCRSIRGAYVLLTSKFVVRMTLGSVNSRCCCCCGFGCCIVVFSKSLTEDDSKLLRSR